MRAKLYLYWATGTRRSMTSNYVSQVWRRCWRSAAGTLASPEWRRCCETRPVGLSSYGRASSFFVGVNLTVLTWTSSIRQVAAVHRKTNSALHNLSWRVYTDCSLTLSPPIPLRLYTVPYWSNPPFLIFRIRTLLDALALRTERQSVRMSKSKNSGLDQYGTGLFEQQQFGTADVEVVKPWLHVKSDILK